MKSEVLESFIKAKTRYQQIINFDDLQVLNNKEVISGIYALFFSCHEIDKIIPLYIGQSKNIKNRFMSHKRELKKLFNLSDDEFKNHITSGKQDGNHLYTKMILFSKANNLLPHDLKIKVLQTNLNKTYFRLKKEQELIDYYQSTIFGFNQLEFIQLANCHSSWDSTYCTVRNVSKMWKTGIDFINNFDIRCLTYGYGQFNVESFISWAWLQIERVESSEIDDRFKYPSKVINRAIFQEFKSKFNEFIKKLDI